MIRTLAILALALLSGGCATQVVDRLHARLGLEAPVSGQAVPDAARKAMAGHHADALAALARNDLDGAVAAWRRYVAATPFQTPATRDAWGYITLLERELARRYAKQAAAKEQGLTEATGERLHLALLPFQNQNEAHGNKRLFNRAIMAMVASDLAQVPSLKVLERQRIDALIQELKLSESALTDPAATLRAGRLLGAGTVVVGTVFNGAPPDKVYTGEGKYTISVNLTDVKRGGLLGVQESYGTQHNFLELEKRIVHGILDILGVKDVPAAVDRVHTRNWDAYARFTAGLTLLAEDRFDEARKEFEMALRFDPNFALAEEYHLATPSRLLTPEQIQAEASKREG